MGQSVEMAKIWNAMAERDLAAARFLANGEFYELAVFLSHGAAACALRAAWCLGRRGPPPNASGLVELAEGLDASEHILAACRRLNPHFAGSRYQNAANGNPADNYDLAFAVELLSLAAQVVEECSGQPVPVSAEAEAEQRDTLVAVRRLALRCRDELEATEVYLFGSRAREDWHFGSDCDVMVLSDRFSGLKRWESCLLIEPLWDGPVSVQPLGLTPEEFEGARDKRGPVAMALADGLIALL